MISNLRRIHESQESLEIDKNLIPPTIIEDDEYSTP
jgi:hypothetical protein